jgi:hypothetical protein
MYIVPAGTIVDPPFDGVKVNADPLQASAVRAGITGEGFTVTVTVNVAPVQVPETGVAVYVTV